MNEHMISEIVETVKEIDVLLSQSKERRYAGIFRRVAESSFDPDLFWKRLLAPEIWGGSGSVVDQIFIYGENEDSKKFWQLIAILGDQVFRSGKSNSSINLLTGRLKRYYNV
ncbi:hypothetical protein [Anderseniella sp. Alg231-50]|uniref:hypothetical protein n=1 Tax=Anderseniella sp. Alg231-50 TaxID=1922226 RepID=UPI00307C38B8